MQDLKNGSIFLNRELSWLRFNTRVLAQCEKDIPLIEKLKFLAIYSTNLDEFYMIRVAGLKQLFIAGITASGSDEMTPLDQLRKIREYLHNEKNSLEIYYKQTIEALANEGFYIKNYDDLNDELRQKADEYFFSNILPIIVPIAVDSTHPFPHLNNLSFALAVKLKDTNDSQSFKFGMIRIPRVIPRFVQVSTDTYTPIETIVHRHAEEIFPGYSLISSAPFRVTRNADIVIEEEEADDFMMILEQGLKLRRKGAFVRLQIAKNADSDITKFLNEHINVFYKDIFEYDIPLSLDGLWGVVGNKNFSNLTLPPYSPKILPPFNENESIFETMDKGDILIYHPYESFNPVEQLIKEASKDPKVVSIRMTLYRVEKNSPIVASLIDAANDGKQVTVMVELKARFDEENNLHWAKSLESAGAHVVYGIPGFKVHAKSTQIIRKNGDKLKFYIHLGTGNYNGSSSKIYTDASFFTTDERFAKDTTTFFHILSGYNKNRVLQTLSMSPMQIKERLIDMIKVEEKKGSDGHIIAKMNALVDSDMIKALSSASKAGVKIELIVRGICCLRPGIPEVSENIRVISIVGKYLEHARIFYFKHSSPEIYISSADWMPRNLERRLELMTPIFNESLKNKMIDILNVQLNDTSLAFELQNDGEYVKLSSENPLNSQEFLEEYYNKLAKNIRKHKDTSNILVSKLLEDS
ncbi:RNA degradosome polyphosphate kinase [Campylobacter ureolyticus]|uniref:RNA degradosome polyphosphate kinase n=1 Tax=Campylobacter ureolyticus TaxID=827 RepID=UPI00046980C6|nr:RNA degradosome polyphosphate kinase [Campylobacter ureolyticus]MCZ6110633.1 RNA degradosome polyphosphate kinase [Campylobacter ureolyticus]MCZ6132793.1 RNA degradosome polyphosphate kinase [Campylobacter ureolyticus]MDK8323043.1 RNA degradosome polyphosphate kinase [Campylobacter ureolyticus]QIX86894.1 RNA degradosome polyphosphate kinase [Campylobacter ureolyticus]STA70802.1 polyphosphate kinase [Campylobacter ureolyticus]